MKVKTSKSNSRSKWRKLLNFLLIVVILTCVGILAKRGYDYYTTLKNKSKIESIVNEAKEEVGTEQVKEDPFKIREKENIQILKKFQEVNSDVIGYIEIPNTYVRYPIMKGIDNDFYLRRDLYKNYDIGGSIFIDSNNSPDFSDDNSVIYGHHLEIEAMFSVLDNYRKQEYAEKNKTIYITTNEGLRQYELFGAYGTHPDYDYRTIKFGNPNDKVPYFKKLKAMSEVELGEKDFSQEDTIITLSTCQYDFEGQRLALHAVRVR